MGFFRWRYKKMDGTMGWNAATFFEPQRARLAYPCWDEPGLKANFTVTLVADKSHTCVSNMDVAAETEVVSQQTGRLKKAVRFHTSPRMSTYLAAWTVGELKYLESRDFHAPVRIYMAPSTDIETAKIPLQEAVKALNFFERAFDFRLELPKVDLMAVTNGGGMENWGMIVFEDDYLSYDESHLNSYDEVFDVAVIYHELAHQWFGDLVTTQYWDNIWLNEGVYASLSFIPGLYFCHFCSFSRFLCQLGFRGIIG
jgi:aminopeptidase 2